MADAPNYKCLKYVMFLFNLLIFICGLVAVTVGVWAIVNAEAFREILVDNALIFDGVYIIIAVGSVLLFLGFLGCWGAFKENLCFLAIFFIFVLIIFIVEIAGAMLMFMYFGEVESAVLDSISSYGDGTSKGNVIKQGWDTLQGTVGCCGYEHYNEWRNNTDWAGRYAGIVVPESCCARDVLSETSSPTNATLCQAGVERFLNTDGCKAKLGDYLWIVAGAGLGILLFELFALITTSCLYRAIVDYKEI
ncbi:tetraspanin-18-like [Styela clava]